MSRILLLCSTLLLAPMASAATVGDVFSVHDEAAACEDPAAGQHVTSAQLDASVVRARAVGAADCEREDAQVRVEAWPSRSRGAAGLQWEARDGACAMSVLLLTQPTIVLPCLAGAPPAEPWGDILP